MEISSASSGMGAQKLTESIITTLIDSTMETTKQAAAVAATTRVSSSNLGRVFDCCA